MGFGDRIKERREALGWTQDQLAERASQVTPDLRISQSQISAIERNEVTRPRVLPEIATALRVSLDWVLGREVEPPPPATEPPSNVDLGNRQMMASTTNELDPIVLFLTGPEPGTKRGRFMLYAEKAGEVFRPPFLRFAKNAFAVKVIDNANAPTYRRGDTIVINPSDALIEDEDCLFTSDLSTAGRPAIIGLLVSSTPETWTVQQYGAPSPISLPRMDFPNAWPIIGRYRRRD